MLFFIFRFGQNIKLSTLNIKTKIFKNCIIIYSIAKIVQMNYYAQIFSFKYVLIIILIKIVSIYAGQFFFSNNYFFS